MTLRTSLVHGTLVARENGLSSGSFRSRVLLIEDHPAVLSCPQGLKRCHLILIRREDRSVWQESEVGPGQATAGLQAGLDWQPSKGRPVLVSNLDHR